MAVAFIAGTIVGTVVGALVALAFALDERAGRERFEDVVDLREYRNQQATHGRGR